MPLPLLEITPKTQNQRVEGFEIPDEDDAPVYRLTDRASDTGITDLIWAAYRQIFSEHLILESYRQLPLESQLRNRANTVREFVRGLGKSAVYQELVGETNSNYRLVDITFKRFLGRATYNQDEQISWSIVIATQGLHGFIDAVVDSEEYRRTFGDDIVPYQRRRMEARPFNLVTPRYGRDWRDRQAFHSLQGRSFYQIRQYRPGEMDKKVVRDAIPVGFLNMAQSMLTPHLDTQRHVARSNNVQIPDMSRSGTRQPSVKPTGVALPYRYIPTTPKV